MKRWGAALLLLVLPFTLAPRTSWDLGNGWRAVVVADGLEGATGGARTLVFAVIPPDSGWGTTSIDVAITGTGTWELVSATAGCARIGNDVSCTLHNTGSHQQRMLRVTVRSLDAGTLNYSLSAAVPI